MSKFRGRKKELGQLKSLVSLNKSGFVVLKGRRRIGKTRLLEEFGKQFKQTFIFSGLPPSKDPTNEVQLAEFIKQFHRQLPAISLKGGDWSDLFWQLSQHTQEGSVLIVLDEISWMGSKDPDFLGKLKNAWDLYFKKNDQLILAVCASASYWVDKNLLSGTAFVGRISLTMTLEELPLHDCLSFWDEEQGVSPFNTLKLLSVTGGIPRYLEEVQAGLSAEENIKRLCFTKNGMLLNEFDNIFNDLFSNRSKQYKNILYALADGMKEQKQIGEKVNILPGSNLTEYLDELITSGFVSRDYTWHIKSGQLSKLSEYRLKDNYSRFYLKYILPRKPKIEVEDLSDISLAELPGWNSMIGLQLENLILSNRDLIKKALNINPSDIVCDNPFFQRKTTKQKGCQIDYLIQTKFNVLYVCEIKFSKKEIGSKVIGEMQEKIKRLNTPKHFSIQPILIHVGEVSDVLEDSTYFTKIIDFVDLIKA